jgi:hypothetical protein
MTTAKTAARPQAPDKRRRPASMTVAAVLFVIIGVLSILAGVTTLSSLNSDVSHGQAVSEQSWVVMYAEFVIGALEIVLGGLMFRPGMPWVRQLALCLCTLGVITDVASLVLHRALTVVDLVVNLGLIVALVRPDGRTWFSRESAA